jgi:hypothetical protein
MDYANSANRGPWNDYAPTPGTKGPVDFSDLVPKGGPVDFSDLIPRNSQPGAPIEVEGPGGVVVEFPAGRSRDVMTAAMRKRFLWKAQPQSESLPQFDAMGNPTGSTVDAPAAPQMPYGDQMMNVARGGGGVSKVLANGMTFGFADQGVAGLRTVSGDAPDYLTAIAQERGQTDAVGSGTPGLNTGLRAAGSALGGLGLLRSGLSLGGRAIEAGAGFFPKLLGFSADGAIAGAADAVGHTDIASLANYRDAALSGAEWGAVTGAALPTAGKVAGATYRAAMPFFARPAEGMTRAATGLLGTP